MLPSGGPKIDYNGGLPLVETDNILNDTSNTNTEYVTGLLSTLKNKNNTNMELSDDDNQPSTSQGITKGNGTTVNSDYETKNRFSLLNNDSNGPEEDLQSAKSRKRSINGDRIENTTAGKDTTNITQRIKMPPIIIKSKLPNNKYINELQKISKDQILSQYRGIENYLISTYNEHDYCQIQKRLTDDKIQYFTYPLHSDKKIVAKGIPPYVENEEIYDFLNERNIKVKKILRMTKTVNGIKYDLPVHIIFLNFEQDLNVFKIINHISGHKISWERLISKSQRVPQCYRCQYFGHTSAFCNMKFRCVKCTKEHAPGECPKTDNELPICVNCSGNHPANFNECRYFREYLEKRTEKNERRKNSTNTISYIPAPTPKPLLKSYSQSLHNFPNLPRQNVNTDNNTNTDEFPTSNMFDTLKDLKELFSDPTVKYTLQTLLKLANDIKKTTTVKEKQSLVFQCFISLCI